MTADNSSRRKASVLVLASASPRRQALLRQIGVRFERVVPDVDETPLAGEPPEVFATRVAMEKAMAGRALANARGLRGPVLGADTCVVLAGAILGKPQHRQQGIDMLARLAGRTHQVLTAVAVVTDTGRYQAVSTSRVTFGPMTAQEISAYWDSGEPADKAGAYAVQGRGALYIARIEGSYSGIVGLPLFEVAGILKNLGIEL